MSERLTELEWIYLTQLIYRLNTIGDVKLFENIFLEKVRVLLPYRKAFFTCADRCGGSIRYLLPIIYSGRGMSEEDERFVNGEYDNFANIFLHMEKSSVIRNSDVISVDKFEKTPLLKEVYQPQGLFYGMKLGLIYEDNLIGYVGFLNAREDGDFSDRDIFVLDILKDHLAIKFNMLLDACQVNRQKEKDPSNCFDFTSRELEVVKLLQAGNSHAEICDILFISESTLNKHIHHIYRKAGVKNRIQLLHKL